MVEFIVVLGSTVHASDTPDTGPTRVQIRDIEPRGAILCNSPNGLSTSDTEASLNKSFHFDINRSAVTKSAVLRIPPVLYSCRMGFHGGEEG